MMKLRNNLGEFRLKPGKIQRRLHRTIRAYALLAKFAMRTRFSKSSLVDPSSEFVVCLTSFGERIKLVHLSIESIASGSERPKRIVLWLDPGDFESAIERLRLQRLVQRGLEVRRGEKRFRAHNKYFHFASSSDEGILVSADDDIFYPKSWLQQLHHTFDQGEGQDVAAHWVRLPRILNGAVAPTLTWSDVTDTRARVGGFTLGVAGVAFPHKLRVALSEAGTAFLDAAPLADDIWISWQALRADVAVRQCDVLPASYIVVPHTQKRQLATVNTLAGENDRQIAATYRQDDIRRLGLSFSHDPRIPNPTPGDNAL